MNMFSRGMGSDDRAEQMRRWLSTKARFLDTNTEVLDGFCSNLVSLSVPVDRAWLHIRTLHPQFAGMSRLWRLEYGVEERYLQHDFERGNTYLASPIRFAVENGVGGRWRLGPGTTLPFPILQELQQEGYSDYVVAPLVYSDGSVNAVSWATRAPAGFSESDLKLLHGLLADLAAIVEIKSLRRFAANMLHTYAGHEPGDLILKGQIRRGDVRTIAAALMLVDLRDFTSMSDALAPSEVIQTLNRYFDAVMPAIAAHGGEVLEIMGDGILAFFGDEAAGSAASACCNALSAAREGLSSIKRVNAAQPGGAIRLSLGMALHHGSVAYGNIGSGDRLDFTVIGRDVNLTSRIERLCRELDRAVLMSRTFAEQLQTPMFEIGHFSLRGVPEMQLLFGVPDETERPPLPNCGRSALDITALGA